MSVRFSQKLHEKALEVHPSAKNLYTTIPQLGFPVVLQSYLLFYSLQMDTSFMENHEPEFLQGVKIPVKKHHCPVHRWIYT